MLRSRFERALMLVKSGDAGWLWGWGTGCGCAFAPPSSRRMPGSTVSLCLCGFHCVRPRRDVPPTGQSLWCLPNFASRSEQTPALRTLLRQRKGTKRKATPLAGRPRADCSALLGLCESGRTHCAACGRCVQTAARSQMWMRADARPAKPCAARRLTRAPRAIRSFAAQTSPVYASLRLGAFLRGDAPRAEW